jgi:uncharacterized protein YgfB (UPF0149 family)
VQKLILKFFQNKTNFGKEKKKVDNDDDDDDDDDEEEKKMKIIGYVCVCFMVCFFFPLS